MMHTSRGDREDSLLVSKDTAENTKYKCRFCCGCTRTVLGIWAERWKWVTRCCEPVEGEKCENEWNRFSCEGMKALMCNLQLSGEITSCWRSPRRQTPPHLGQSTPCATAWNAQTHQERSTHALNNSDPSWNTLFHLTPENESHLFIHTVSEHKLIMHKVRSKNYLGLSVWLCLYGFHSFVFTQYIQASPVRQIKQHLCLGAGTIQRWQG